MTAGMTTISSTTTLARGMTRTTLTTSTKDDVDGDDADEFDFLGPPQIATGHIASRGSRERSEVGIFSA
jgi:hypothetical protein